MSVIVRDCTMEDIDDIVFLMGELGYPTSYEDMKGRFKNISSDSSYCTLLAEVKGKVVGMVGLQKSYIYEKTGTMCVSLPWWYKVILEVTGLENTCFQKLRIGQRIKGQYQCLSIVVIVQNEKQLTYFTNDLGLLQKALALLKSSCEPLN